MKFHLSFLAALLAAAPVFSQREMSEATGFTISFEGKSTRFTPQMPPLSQIPGAPLAFYSFHWEFGDGNFSNAERPVYPYSQPGSHSVYLAATAVYDKGKPPKDKKGIVPAAAGLMADAQKGPPFKYVFEKNGRAVALKANHDARPDEEIVLILSYQNTAAVPTDGTLHLFFNEKTFPERHFSFQESRLHFGETALSIADYGLRIADSAPQIPQSAIRNPQSNYRDEQVIQFKKLAPGEKRNAFFTLVGTPEMLADVSALIHLNAVFVPTAAGLKPEECTLEIPIVASHDPNLIAVSDSRLNFRYQKKEKLEYNVRFQNNGDGPAKKIELTVELPRGLNPGKMRPVDWYPRCPICPTNGPKTGCLDTATTKNSLVFTFQNVWLPGSKQAKLTDRDSTKGFVKYRIEPEKRMAKRPFSSRASIVFDKNPPVLTNFSKTRFKKGLSPGVKIGYNFHPDSLKNGAWFAGLSLSPFKSWRVYPQIELLAGRSSQPVSFDSPLKIDTFHVFNVGDLAQDSVVLIERSGSRRSSWFEIPVLLRKNFSPFFGLGLGASVRFQKNSGTDDLNRTTEILNYHFEINPGGTGQLVWDGKKNATTSSSSTSFSNRKTQLSAFADLTFGAVRAGPNLGIRAGGQFADGGFQPFVQASFEFKF